MKEKYYNIYAIVQKKDGYEYKKGEIVEVSLFRRSLKMTCNKKFQKVVKIIENFYNMNK